MMGKSEIRNPKSEDAGETPALPGGPGSWFNSEARILRLREVADSWIGTRFFSNGNTKGRGLQAGVSCQKLCEGIYRECGVLDIVTPKVQMAHAQFSSESLVEGFMALQICRTNFAILQLPGAELLPGDLIALRIKKVSHHLGVMVSKRRFIQALEGQGVIYSDLSDGTYGSRLVAAWRPRE
jgi:cell wall-associated NlpC family hydrolase